MSRIVSCEIKGLAGRRKTVNLAFGRTNVFWGHNGSGKTSLLKILHSALANDATALVRVPFTSARVVLIDETGREIVRSVTRDEILGPLKQLTVAQRDYVIRRAALGDVAGENQGWSTSPPAKGVGADGAFPHGYLPISRISEARSRRPGTAGAVRELVDEASFDKLFAQQIQDLWRDFSARASIRVTTAQELGIAQILTSVLSSQTRGSEPHPVTDTAEAYDMVRSFLVTQRLGRMVRVDKETFAASYESSGLVQEVVLHVAQVQHSVEEALAPQRRVEELLNSLYFGDKRVNLSSRDVLIEARGERVPLESLSSGEKQLMQLLLEVLAAGANPVIIDEPELSLHVDWQRRLVSYFDTINSASQVIMATHSPEVLAELPDVAVMELA